MFIKRFHPFTPLRRNLQLLICYEKNRLKKKYLTYLKKTTPAEHTPTGHHNNRGLRFLRHFKIFNTFQYINKKINYVCVKLFTAFNKKKEYGLYKTIYNFELLLPATQLVIPGTVLSLRFRLITNLHFFLLTSLINPLQILPYEMPFCFVQNKRLQKWTYGKAAGITCFRYVVEKNSKLDAIVLPSKQIKYLSIQTLCIAGNLESIGLNFLNLAKSTSSYKTKIKTIVRGVAMNAVDHPNGGRTKAKQPEKTPWGNIAKHNK